MRRVMNSVLWFIGLAIVANIIFHDQSLGYFWLMIGAVSLFFGFQSVNQLNLDHVSVQIAHWITTYQDLSYFKQQLYLSEVVNGALRRNQAQQALEFLNYILKLEPDNETAKSLMASVWGAELASEYR